MDYLKCRIHLQNEEEEETQIIKTYDCEFKGTDVLLVLSNLSMGEIQSMKNWKMADGIVMLQYSIAKLFYQTRTETEQDDININDYKIYIETIDFKKIPEKSRSYFT